MRIPWSDKLLDLYEKKYRLLIGITTVILVLSLVQIGWQTATQGEFIHKGISLRGGMSITVPTHEVVDIIALEKVLAQNFEEAAVRSLKTTTGDTSGFIVELEIDISSVADTEKALDLIRKETGLALTSGEYSVEGMGQSLGASFFRETMLILVVSFILMAIVVFIAFRSFVPSVAVILCAFSDMVVTIAILNIFNVKFSTAGIAALLMMIGYSVDTDILLTTKVLKQKVGSVSERILRAGKTGVYMTIITVTVAAAGFFLTNSDTIKQIMLVVWIGLFVDLLFTWFQNVAILRWYLKRKEGAQ